MEETFLGEHAKALIGFVSGMGHSHNGCICFGGMIMPPGWEPEPWAADDPRRVGWTEISEK